MHKSFQLMMLMSILQGFTAIKNGGGRRQPHRAFLSFFRTDQRPQAA